MRRQGKPFWRPIPICWRPSCLDARGGLGAPSLPGRAFDNALEGAARDGMAQCQRAEAASQSVPSLWMERTGFGKMRARSKPRPSPDPNEQSMQKYQRILLITDGSDNARAAEQTALDLAQTTGSQIRLIDTVRPPSRISRWLEANAENVFQMVVNEKEKQLEKTASFFREAGVPVETAVLCGPSSGEITRDAVQYEPDLVVRYMKGFRSRYPGLFGNTSRNLMRTCPAPLLLVGDKPVQGARVLACVNAEHDSQENNPILRQAELVAGEKENLHLLYCWKFYGGDMYKEHMGEAALNETMKKAEEVHLNLFNNYLIQHGLDLSDPRVHLENGDPVDVIPEVCRREAIDVLVMSSGSLNHPMHRLLGSTVESILDQIQCALLVVKPEGFAVPSR